MGKQALTILPDKITDCVIDINIIVKIVTPVAREVQKSANEKYETGGRKLMDQISLCVKNKIHN